MYKLTSTLLAGSGITPESHPVLVGLIELAAARPPDPLGDPVLQKRFHRQWKIVMASFALLRPHRVTDAQVKNARPFPGLRLQGSGWVCSALALEVRPLVAEALGRIAAQALAGRLSGVPVVYSPCRFCCEGKSLLLTGGAAGMHVECRNCGAKGPVFPTVDEALRAWNAPAVEEVAP